MTRPVRIGNACGFWGDRPDAAREMLSQEPDLDFLTFDFLAEVSMSILALQRSRDPDAGWPRDFAEILHSIAPYWRGGGHCRVIANAGGLNPWGCARACREILQREGCAGRTIAVVAGDDVLELIRAGSANDELLRNLDTRQPMADVSERLLTANAYLGARPIAEALAQGADLVITGRVADPSLTVAPCAYWFGWQWDDWDRLAGATVAGHLIECGTQLTGGISTDWLHTPGVDRIGFPIAEVGDDGTCVVTKSRGSGGRVCRQTVTEQLLYEIGDPDAYLSPDATVSLLALCVDEETGDRVRIRGARGRAAPASYKVSATYQDGFRAQGHLTLFGNDVAHKARQAGEAVLARLRADGVSLRESLIECLGAGACRPQGIDPAIAEELRETVLRIAVADDSRQSVERFARALMALVTAGPPGTTGYAEGRPRVHPSFRFWPCLIERDRVQPRVTILYDADQVPAHRGQSAPESVVERRPEGDFVPSAPEPQCPAPVAAAGAAPAGPCGLNRDSPRAGAPRRLADIAYARSGDKGINANIGVIARCSADFPQLCRELTAPRVAAYFGLADGSPVTRYEMPGVAGLNFVIQGILANPLRVDAQGKALGQALLEMPLEVTP
jgi:hypothetical protein